MQSIPSSSTTNQKRHRGYRFSKLQELKGGNKGNLFFVNSLIDNHTVLMLKLMTNCRFRTNLFDGNEFSDWYWEGKVSKNSIYLNHVLLLSELHNNLSPGCLVKSGYEFKLSKDDSYICKNGEKVLRALFLESNWVVDVNPPQPEGFVEDIKPASTKKIHRKIKKDLYEALNKVELKRSGGTRGMFEVKLQQSRNLRRYRLAKIENHLKLNNGNVSWVLNSCCSFHSITVKENLINIRGCKDEWGNTIWVGDYMLGNLLLKDVRYKPRPIIGHFCNYLSLNKLAEEGFEIYLTNQNATITRDGEVFLTAPMVGKLWILNSLHEQKGWLKNGCPYEAQERIDFETKYGSKFTKEEIKQLFDDLTHDCEIKGPSQIDRAKLGSESFHE